MQTCPRCGAENDEARAACWNCFGQLKLPIRTAAKRVVLKDQKPAEAATEPEAPAGPEASNDVSAVGTPIPELAENETEDERAPIDLDELAQAVSVAGPEETAPVPGAEAEVRAPEHRETAPAPEVMPTGGVTAPPGAPAAQPEAALERRRSERPARARRFPVFIPLVILVLGALAAWWFLLANPSPSPVAKRYVPALAAAMSGDTTELQAICTPGSRAYIASMRKMMSTVPTPPGFALKMTAGEINSVSVTGGRAEVGLTANTSFGDTQMQVSSPLRVALIREGSMLRRKWKVDLAATNRLAQEDARRMFQQLSPEGMPGKAPGVPSAPAMPPTPK